MPSKYEYLLPIARGGMAEVWAAKSIGARGFERIVAVKAILPDLRPELNAEKALLDEARIASRLRHPNVVDVLDLTEENGRLHFVMEWIDGAPLSRVMREAARNGGMPLNLAVRIVQDVCAGLHAAHELRDDDGASFQLVHRDVSPQNIMIADTGVVKLLDFGVAKIVGHCAEATADGMIKGKVPFMAPEQLMGLQLDRRTDIFAVGVILFQMVTGKHPFNGRDLTATMRNIMTRKLPKPSTLVLEPCPDVIDQVVMRALERRPEDRFQTAAELSKALDDAFSGRHRATTEDVAAYVRSLLGTSREAFRRALREASPKRPVLQLVVDPPAPPKRRAPLRGIPVRRAVGLAVCSVVLFAALAVLVLAWVGAERDPFPSAGDTSAFSTQEAETPCLARMLSEVG